MEEDKYIEELYKKYEAEFIRNKEYQKSAEKLEKKYDEIKVNFTEEQLKDIEEFEQCLVELLGIEVKEAFKYGFKIGKDFDIK